jgi:peptidoglycan/LPS O-acetylase OafA/YrhL
MPALTSLRFFAAFYVFMFHAAPWTNTGSAQGPATSLQQVWIVFCSHGFSAVGFFFVLSGFILASNYPAENGIDKPRFYRARFARVYPVYLLGLVVAVPFLVSRTWREGTWGHAAIECALAVTLLQAWVPTYWNAVNVPGWSLSVEAFFYATYPFIAGPLTRAARTPAQACYLLAILYFCALAVPAIGTWGVGIGFEDASPLANAIRYMPPLALPQFAFGILLGHMRLQGFDAPSHMRRLFFPALLLLAVFLAADVIPYLLQHNGALLPLFAIIILRCAQIGAGGGFFCHPALQRLGEASYSLYVLHLLVWIYVKIIIQRSGYDPAASWTVPIYATCVVGASLASYCMIEKPARQWLVEKWKLRAART